MRVWYGSGPFFRGGWEALKGKEGRKEEGKTSFVRSLEHATTTGSDPFAS